MNGIPSCPIHGAQMRQSDRDPSQYYCTKKVGTGPKDYCPQRCGPNGFYLKGQTQPSVPQTHQPGYYQPPAPAPVAPQASPAAPGSTIGSDLRLRAALGACEAAATRYAGTGVSPGEVEQLARQLFLGLLEPAATGAAVQMPGPDDDIPFDHGE